MGKERRRFNGKFKSHKNSKYLGTVNSSPSEESFSKECVAIDVIRKISEAHINEVDNDKWFKIYYNTILAGDKNGRTVAQLATAPNAITNYNSSTIGRYKLEKEEYEDRAKAASSITTRIMSKVSPETHSILLSMSKTELSLPDPFNSFKEYIQSKTKVDYDPVLVFTMINKAIIKQNIGTKPVSAYATQMFDNVKMKRQETAAEFQIRFENVVDYIKMTLDNEERSYPWRAKIGEQTIDFSVAHFMAKLLMPEYRELAKKGMDAINEGDIREIPTTISAALKKALASQQTNETLKTTDQSQSVLALVPKSNKNHFKSKAYEKKTDIKTDPKVNKTFQSRSEKPCPWCKKIGHYIYPSKFIPGSDYCQDLKRLMEKSKVIAKFVTSTPLENLISEAGRAYINSL